MGADISIRKNVALIRGVEKLTGAPVKATDLRASASLVIAGLIAKGETEIGNIFHLLRGYEDMDKKLNLLGCEVVLL
jgi:UDP-N-acetylglucosamine 1-carboxyvinyltransferase